MSIVTTLEVDSLQGSEGRITTIGHVFREGDIPAGTSLHATFAGQDVPVQLDVKATWPDGSAKHAVLSFENPANADAGTLVLGQTEAAGVGAPLDLAAQAQAQDYSFIVDIDGETFDVADLLGEGDPWLEGPLATEKRVTQTLENGLEVRVDVRATADGEFYTSVIVGNDNIETTTLEAKTYAVSLTQNGETVYSNEALTQPHFTVWREAYSTEETPNTAHSVYDLDYMRQTNLLPSIDDTIALTDSTQYADTLNHDNATFDPLELGGIDNVGGIDEDRGRTGITPSYGLITDDQHSYLVTQSAETREAMLALTDQYGAFSNYYRNPETGEAYFLEDTESNSSETGIGKDLPGTGGVVELGNDGHALRNSFSHKPSEYYLSYLVTGDRYYADGLAHEAASSLQLWSNASYLTEDGHVNFDAQLREQAWVLRDLFYAASLAPDGSHAAAVLDARLDAALQDYVDFYVHGAHGLTSEDGSPLTDNRASASFVGGDLEGALQSYNGTAVDRPYWQDWFAMIVGQIALTGNENAVLLGQWMAGFGAERFLQDDFDPNHSLFSILDYPLSGGSRYLDADTTWQELNDASAAVGGVGADANPWQEGDFTFYAASAWGGTAAAFSGVRDARYAEALLWMTTQLTDEYITRVLEGGTVPQFGVPVTFDDHSIAGIHDRTVGNDLSNGIIDGDGNRLIHAGGGNDLIVTGEGSHLVDGGDGDDFIKGGSGEDWLFGGSGADTLSGGAGINYLQGDRFDEDFERYSDTFVFSGVLGETTIGDFTVGQDRFLLTGVGELSSIEDVLSGFEQVGEDAVLDLGASGSLTLTNVDASALSDVDVIVTSETTAVDLDQSQSWETKTSVHDASTGELISEEIVFDSGKIRNQTYIDGTISSNIVTQADGDLLTTLYNLDGVRMSFTFEDLSDSRNWESYTNSYEGDDGQMMAQELIYDDGGTRSRSYINGTMATNVLNRANGDVLTSLYNENGVRISLTFEDISDSRGWESYVNTYDGVSGLLSSRDLVFDNGDIGEREFVDGILSSTVTYEADGDFRSSLHNAEGIRTSFSISDLSNTRNWDNYTNSYDEVSGVITGQVLRYDNGDVRVREYTDGVLTSTIVYEAPPPNDTFIPPHVNLPFEGETTETFMGSGSLYGTAANDLIIPTSANVQVHGEDGNDVFQLDKSWVAAFGGAGNDIFYLQGLNQRVTGGDGSDAFVIAGPLISSTIQDFNAAKDTLYFANGVGGIDDFEDFSLAARQEDGAVVISTASGDARLENTELTDLNETNVQFYRNEATRADALDVPQTGAPITGSGWLAGTDENDLITSGGGNIQISGGFGHDHLIAEHWGVRLLGGNGQDLVEARDLQALLFGGSGADQFYFTNRVDGTIGDFQAGIDRVIVSEQSGFETTENIVAALVETDEGVVLSGNNGDQLLFTGISLSQLDESDFLIG